MFVRKQLLSSFISLCLIAILAISVEQPAVSAANFEQAAPSVSQEIDASEGYWVLEKEIPIPRLDNSVNVYNGKVYVLGGFESAGTSYRYDPSTDTWEQLATMSPEIEYTSTGCLGFDSSGEAVIAVFPDSVSSVFYVMVYHIEDDFWEQRSIPAPLPYGIWQPAVVSDLENNVCYITAGATGPGFGNLDTFYAYHPDTHTAEQLPSFTTARDYHAAWFIPQWGQAGYVCVAGGVNDIIFDLNSTQCYDIVQNEMRPENADLPPLPYKWSGGAYALQIVNGSPRPWILGGVVAWFPSNLTTYYDVSQGIWVPGPNLPYALTRTDADSLDNEFYIVGGNIRSFVTTAYNQHFTPGTLPGCAEVEVFFDDFEGANQWYVDGEDAQWHRVHEGSVCGSQVAPLPSPVAAWYFGSETSGCTYETGGYTTNGYLTLYHTLAITDSQYATIRFSSYEETECADEDADCLGDYRYLEVSYDGRENWTMLWRGVNEGEWYPVEVSTHAYPGETLDLRFYFTSQFTDDNDYLGWFLDNVQVTTCMEGPIPPQASFEVSSPACAGQPVSFTNTTYGDEPLSYLWDFGDGSSSTEISPTHTYTNPGWYTAVLTATNALGSDTASQDLGVRPAPQASFYAEDVAFEDTPVVFQNQSRWAQRYLWVFGDGGKSRRPNPVHVFSDPGMYTVRLVAGNRCGRDVFQKPIEIVPLP